MPTERRIPHEHRCHICGDTEGCENKYCKVMDLYKVCDKEECQARWSARTIHAVPLDAKGILPCCGVSKLDTPPSDTMTVDSAKVTCKGIQEIQKAGVLLSD